jgi:hypothetical protein
MIKKAIKALIVWRSTLHARDTVFLEFYAVDYILLLCYTSCAPLIVCSSAESPLSALSLFSAYE